MLHGGGNSVDGAAAARAVRVGIGEPVSPFGPGPATFVDTHGATWYLLAADMTGAAGADGRPVAAAPVLP